jgi:hypothetical protein
MAQVKQISRMKRNKRRSVVLLVVLWFLGILFLYFSWEGTRLTPQNRVSSASQPR